MPYDLMGLLGTANPQDVSGGLLASPGWGTMSGSYPVAGRRMSSNVEIAPPQMKMDDAAKRLSGDDFSRWMYSKLVGLREPSLLEQAIKAKGIQRYPNAGLFHVPAHLPQALPPDLQRAHEMYLNQKDMLRRQYDAGTRNQLSDVLSSILGRR